MHTRVMTQADIAPLLALKASHDGRPWSYAMFLEELNMGAFCRILTCDATPYMGYLVARLQVDEWHLLALSVAPPFRRQGGATCLLNSLIQYATQHNGRAILLEVRASNHPARTLYQDMGFDFLYTRPSYYRCGVDREDAVVLDYRLPTGGKLSVGSVVS